MLDNFLANNSVSQLGSILIGLAVLTLGRRLFWLVTGVAGFIAGLSLIARLLTDQPDWLVLVVALFAGIIGAVLAIFLQKAAVGLAGLLLGGFTAVSLLNLIGPGFDTWAWLVFIIGGVIGLVLALSLLEPALIILSALAGAILIIQAVNLSPLVTLILFVALLVVGIAVQTKMLPPNP